MQQRAERAIRGTLLGTASTTLAAAGHAIAGGGVPGWLAVLVGVVAAGAGGALIVGRRPSLVRTAIVVVGAQAAFHYLFAGLGGSGVDLAAPHVHGATHLTADGGHAAHLTDPGMLTAHLVAAGLTLLLIRRAETAVWRMLRRALARILAPIAAPAPDPAPRPRTPASRPRVAPRRSAHPPRPLRGPPGSLFA